MLRELIECLPRSADDFGTIAAMGILSALGYLILSI